LISYTWSASSFGSGPGASIIGTTRRGHSMPLDSMRFCGPHPNARPIRTSSRARCSAVVDEAPAATLAWVDAWPPLRCLPARSGPGPARPCARDARRSSGSTLRGGSTSNGSQRRSCPRRGSRDGAHVRSEHRREPRGVGQGGARCSP